MGESRAHHFAGGESAGLPRSHDDAALWAALASASEPGAFCRAWLDLQCTRTRGTVGGMILLESGTGSFAPAAIWPPGPSNIDPLRKAGEAALAQGRPVIERDAHQPDQSSIAYPVQSAGHVHGVVVLAIAGARPAVLQSALRELHWGVGWILSLVWQHRAETQGRSGATAASAIDLLAAVQEHETLQEAGMALCNELSRAIAAERVVLGLVRKDVVKLLTMSHGAWFRKRSDIAEAVEAAMDEALAQGEAILFPGEDGGGPITIQHARLAAAAGSASLASVPMMDRGLTIGVLTLERGADAEPFTADDLLFCETAAALVAPTFALKQREERLVSGRIRGQAMAGAKALFGPRRPLAKALGIGALLALLVLFLPTATFRVSADAALEGRVQRAAAVPFSGFIARSHARAGDVVREGQLLATLDDRDLKLDHARSLSAVRQLDRRYRESLAKHERSEMNLFGAQLRQAEAELSLVEYKLARVKIAAPLSGVLVSGDVSQLVGSPVEEGEVLFEVAPLDDFRVVLQVEEGDISYLQPGQRGNFAPTGLAGSTAPFIVTKLTSVTANQDGKNVFRVEAELAAGAPPALRPGMEGVAKVGVDRRSRFWIWTRGVRDWWRLFLWKWLP